MTKTALPIKKMYCWVSEWPIPLSGHLALAKPDIRCMFPAVFQFFHTGNCEHEKPWLSAALVPPVPAPLPSTGHNCAQPLHPLPFFLHARWWVLVPEPLVSLVQLSRVHLSLHSLTLCCRSSSVFPWQTRDLLCTPQCASHTPPPAKRCSPNPRKTNKQTSKQANTIFWWFQQTLSHLITPPTSKGAFVITALEAIRRKYQERGPSLAINIWKRRPSWFNPLALMLSWRSERPLLMPQGQGRSTGERRRAAPADTKSLPGSLLPAATSQSVPSACSMHR